MPMIRRPWLADLRMACVSWSSDSHPDGRWHMSTLLAAVAHHSALIIMAVRVHHMSLGNSTLQSICSRLSRGPLRHPVLFPIAGCMPFSPDSTSWCVLILPFTSLPTYVSALRSPRPPVRRHTNSPSTVPVGAQHDTAYAHVICTGIHVLPRRLARRIVVLCAA